MIALFQRSIPARRPSACRHCGIRIEPGEPITPGLTDGWWCSACDQTCTPLNRLIRWMRYHLEARQLQTLDPSDVRLLVDALTDRSVPARSRGAHDSWHTTSPRFATLDQPFLEDAHGLLLDSLHHDFPARMPAPGITAILDVLDPASD